MIFSIVWMIFIFFGIFVIWRIKPPLVLGKERVSYGENKKKWISIMIFVSCVVVFISAKSLIF